MSSMPYLKGDAPSLLDTFVPKITHAYITSRCALHYVLCMLCMLRSACCARCALRCTSSWCVPLGHAALLRSPEAPQPASGAQELLGHQCRSELARGNLGQKAPNARPHPSLCATTYPLHPPCCSGLRPPARLRRRLDSVRAVAQNGATEDPLDNDEQLQVGGRRGGRQRAAWKETGDGSRGSARFFCVRVGGDCPVPPGGCRGLCCARADAGQTISPPRPQRSLLPAPPALPDGDSLPDLCPRLSPRILHFASCPLRDLVPPLPPPAARKTSWTRCPTSAPVSPHTLRSASCHLRDSFPLPLHCLQDQLDSLPYLCPCLSPRSLYSVSCHLRDLVPCP